MIAAILGLVGPVKHFRLVTDRHTQRHRGFGFCEYFDQSAAHDAIKRINGQDVNGRRLKVAASGNSGNVLRSVVLVLSA